MIQLYRANALHMLRRDIGLFDAVITDPPYASGATLSDKQQGTARKYTATKERCPYPDFVGDQMDQRSWTRMMREVLSAAREHCRPGAILAIFIDWRNLPTLYDAIQWAGWSLRGLVVWDKLTSRPQPGRFRQQTECIVWGSNGPLPLDRGVGYLPGIFRATNVQVSERLHQTQKPLEIMREIIKITVPGGRILDPFAGSGTTLVAAQLEGYDAVGCEVHRAIAATAAQRLDVPLLPRSALPDAPELPPPDAQGASV